MRSVYGWYLAQLIALVCAILMVRGSFVVLGGYLLNVSLRDLPEQLAVLDPDGAAGMAGVEMPGEGGASLVQGDALSNAPPMRRDGPVHVDHQRAGQLVNRDGQRVILIDNSDPENEIWIPLDEKTPLAWYAQSGLTPYAAAVLGGVGLYLLMWGCWTFLGRLAFREPETS